MSAADDRYNVSEKGLARNARYDNSEKGRARRARYRASGAGQGAQQRQTRKHRLVRIAERRAAMDAYYQGGPLGSSIVC